MFFCILLLHWRGKLSILSKLSKWKFNWKFSKLKVYGRSVYKIKQKTIKQRIMNIRLRHFIQDKLSNCKKVVRCEKGLSIPEVLIAIIAIGIFLGPGVFRTADRLISESRASSIINTVKVCFSSYNEFVSKYGALPGDYDDANASFKGKNGNGDGVVSGDPFDTGSEAFMFWEHMAKSGSAPLSGPFDGKVLPGKTVFKLPYGCLIGVMNDPFDRYKGLWLILCNKNKKAAIPYDVARKIVDSLGSAYDGLRIVNENGDEANEGGQKVIVLIKLD